MTVSHFMQTVLTRIKKSSYFIVVVLLFLLLQSCRNDNKNIKGKHIFRYNESSGIVTLDPAFARDQAHLWVCNQLYNGLVQLDDSLNIKPAIAHSWKISKDGKTYTFYLRNDVFFHDDPVFNGKKRKVTAHDFVYSFQRLASPSTASPGSWVFSKVAGHNGNKKFIAENDTVFKIILKTPFPPFLGILTMQYCSVIPHEAVKFYGNDFRRHPVGTGPFYLKNWVENIKLVLRKNPGYFEYSKGKRLPFLDGVAISFLPDKMTAFLQFTQGKFDFLSGIAPSYKDELLDRRGNLRNKYKNKITLLKCPYMNTEYLGILVDTSINGEKLSPLKIKAVRKAVQYGFDRKKMVMFLRNGIGIAGNKGIIPAGFPAYDKDASYGYFYSPDSSRKLLKQAGFSEKNPLPPVTLYTTAEYVDLCKFIQSQLEDVGITINLNVLPAASMREMKANQKLEFFRASWIADYPDEENYLSLFLSDNFAPAGPNYTHFSDKTFDSLYNVSMSVINTEKRTAIYRKMDSIVMEQSPVVILYYDQVLRFVNKRVKGMTVNPVNLLNLKNVKIDE
jgi:peptide/nickel transport system substrate-binding protein